MDRRTYLGSLGVAGLTSVAGCLGDALGGGGSGGNGNETSRMSNDPEAVLAPPEGKRGSTQYDPSYPRYGEAFPSFSLPDPIAGTTVSLADFVDDRPFLMTYIYTSCPDGACPMLLQHLHRVQEDAAKKGYESDVAMLAVTFDPNRDTAEALRSFGTKLGIDYEATNWHFLRPKNNERARTLLTETFGNPIQRREELPSHNGSTTGNESTSDNESGTTNESTTHDHGAYAFTHFSLVHLVNERGVVERAYPKAATQRDAVNTEVILEDTRTVVGVDG